MPPRRSPYQQLVWDTKRQAINDYLHSGQMDEAAEARKSEILDAALEKMGNGTYAPATAGSHGRVVDPIQEEGYGAFAEATNPLREKMAHKAYQGANVWRALIGKPDTINPHPWNDFLLDYLPEIHRPPTPWGTPGK
jgi:hypothetical protein